MTNNESINPAAASDTFVETETISYGSRVGDSFKGMIPGLLLFLAGFPLLFWNEGRAVKTARALDEGQGVVIEVDTNKEIDPDNEGKLVHMTGKADTQEILEDPDFGVAENCIRLERRAEIYQWVENAKTTEKKNMGGSVTRSTTYSYALKWCDDAVDSSGFKKPGHDNPAGGKEFASETWLAEDVAFGAFHLSDKHIQRIGGDKSYRFPENFTARVDRVQMTSHYLFLPVRTFTDNTLTNAIAAFTTNLVNGVVTNVLGAVAANSNVVRHAVRDVASSPQPGDMRISYRIVKPHDISLVAKQRGESFVAFTSKKGDGYKVDLLQDGVADAAEMFESARTGNAVLTWFLRIVGFMIMCLGLKKVLAPLSTIGDVLPFLGSILSVGLGFVAGVIAFVCALVTIAVAWIFYRPVVGVILLVVAGGGIYLLWSKRAAIKDKAAQIKSAVDAKTAKGE